MSTGLLFAQPPGHIVEKKNEEGYIPMNWQEDSGRKTGMMMEYIREDQVLRQVLYPTQGKLTSTLMTATKCHEQIAEHLLKDDARYVTSWPRLKAKYGLAVKSRLHKLSQAYIHKRALLNNNGVGLSDADWAKFPNVNNLQELVRLQFVWYDDMDEFCHEWAIVRLNSLMNSVGTADVTVVGFTRGFPSQGSRGGGKKQRLVEKAADMTLGDEDDESDAQVVKAPLVRAEAKEKNLLQIRGNWAAALDLSPIVEAIRDGDILREKNEMERLIAMENFHRLDRESKERRAAAVLAYKLKRDELRSQVARSRILADQAIKLKEIELEGIWARLRQKELALEKAKAMSLGAPPHLYKRADEYIAVTEGAKDGQRASGSLAHLLL